MFGVAGAGALAYALITAPVPPPQPTKAQAGVLSMPTAAAPKSSALVTASKPVSLRIPSIGVDAPVGTLGLNSNGTVQVPSEPMHAGWYTDSVSPGQAGAAVILGHVDFVSTGPAVFYRLGSLAPGAAVTVARQDGTSATFTVTAVREYPKSDFPTSDVYEAGRSTAQLRLVTCGDWDADRHAYTGNIVVFATLTAVSPAKPTAAAKAAKGAATEPTQAAVHTRPQ